MDTRTRQATQEVGETTIRRPTAVVLVAGFLLTLGLGPVTWLWQTETIDSATSAGQTNTDDLLLGAARDAWDELRRGHVLDANRTLRMGLAAYEARQDESHLATLGRPPAQWLLTRFGGAGNRQVYVGREGWLFLTAATDHVTGPGFLSDRHRRSRLAVVADNGDPPGIDPLAAIVDFARQLEARDIRLLVVPTPGKASIHPAALARIAAPPGAMAEPIVNSDHHRFVRELERAGIAVFDPAPLLLAATSDGRRTAYLETDSHWRPEAVTLVARELARRIAEVAGLQFQGAHKVGRFEPVRVSHTGDLLRALDLPSSQSFLGPETVTLRPIADPVSVTETAAASLWRPDPEADILLLGDSFTNIYSHPDLGWGRGAGLAEQLSHALGRPVDRIAINAGGAFTSRQRLAELRARGDPRLDGKKLVIYQFASRELSFGDWRLIDIDGP